jgi:hypothetical protein
MLSSAAVSNLAIAQAELISANNTISLLEDEAKYVKDVNSNLEKELKNYINK